METLLKKDELIDKIKIFNKIFELDFINSDEFSKNWKSYLDPISKHLYNKTYLSLINDVPLEGKLPPGSLEIYYNMFNYILHDLKSMRVLKIVDEIYCAAQDVKRTFDEFLSINNFHVSINKQIVNDNEVISYQLFPTI